MDTVRIHLRVGHDLYRVSTCINHIKKSKYTDTCYKYFENHQSVIWINIYPNWLRGVAIMPFILLSWCARSLFVMDYFNVTLCGKAIKNDKSKDTIYLIYPFQSDCTEVADIYRYNYNYMLIICPCWKMKLHTHTASAAFPLKQKCISLCTAFYIL